MRRFTSEPKPRRRVCSYISRRSRAPSARNPYRKWLNENQVKLHELPGVEEGNGYATNGHPDEPLVKQDLLSLPLREAREQFERAYLQQQLVLCDGKVGKLAKRVGMERTHLYRKLRSLGVDFRSVSTADD